MATKTTDIFGQEPGAPQPVRIKAGETFKVEVRLSRIVSITLDSPFASMDIARADGRRERLMFDHDELVATMNVLARAWRASKRKRCEVRAKGAKLGA